MNEMVDVVGSTSTYYYYYLYNYFCFFDNSSLSATIKVVSGAAAGLLYSTREAVDKSRKIPSSSLSSIDDLLFL